MTSLPPAETLVEQLATTLAERLQDVPDPAMVGIHSGGVWIAERLHRHLGLTTPLGHLDISFYRDDFSRIGMHPQVRPSHLPFEVDERNIVLVDDVLFTGRTVRAALNEIFDYGRPARVLLAVLIDRGQRELPVAADACALRIDLPTDQEVKLKGPEPLTFVVQSL